MRNYWISSVCMLALTAAPTWADTGRDGGESAARGGSAADTASRSTDSNTASAESARHGSASEQNSATALKSAADDFPAEGKLFCDARALETPGDEDGDWRVFQRDNEWRTCLFQGIRACCWDADQSPPDVSYGRGQICAQKICGNQYDADDTQALPADELTEEEPQTTAAPGRCAHAMRTDATGKISPLLVLWMKKYPAATAARCERCCERTGREDDTYLDACNEACDALSSDDGLSGEDFAHDICLPVATNAFFGKPFVSRRRCTTCCRRGVLKGYYPSTDLRACMLTCREG